MKKNFLNQGANEEKSKGELIDIILCALGDEPSKKACGRTIAVLAVLMFLLFSVVVFFQVRLGAHFLELMGSAFFAKYFIDMMKEVYDVSPWKAEKEERKRLARESEGRGPEKESNYGGKHILLYGVVFVVVGLALMYGGYYLLEFLWEQLTGAIAAL